MKKDLEEHFSEIGGNHEIEVYIQTKEKELKALFDKKAQKIKKKLERKAKQ